MLGMIALANTPRARTAEVLNWLHSEGIRPVCLISGDTPPIVEAISREFGFDECSASLHPEDKAEYIRNLEHKNHRVLMVGDGVNDALALSEATIGVSLGNRGTEAAIEASDITLVVDDLEGLVILRQLSQESLKTIEQNFWIASFTNIFGIFLGFFGLLPAILVGGLHVGHTLGIMLNSNRLLMWRAPGLKTESRQ
jgi:cation-transporting P-type ATPase C